MNSIDRFMQFVGNLRHNSKRHFSKGEKTFHNKIYSSEIT